jgi:hypothetical protein
MERMYAQALAYETKSVGKGEAGSVGTRRLGCSGRAVDSTRHCRLQHGPNQVASSCPTHAYWLIVRINKLDFIQPVFLLRLLATVTHLWMHAAFQTSIT